MRNDVVIASILVYQKTLFLELLLEFVVDVKRKLVILINAYLKRRVLISIEEDIIDDR